MTEKAMKKSTYRQISKINWSRGCTCALFYWTCMWMIRLHDEILPVKHKPCLRLQKKNQVFFSNHTWNYFTKKKKKIIPTVLQLWSSSCVIHTSRALQAYGCICVWMSVVKWGRTGSFKEVETIQRGQDCLWRCVDLWGMRWK